MPSTKEKFFESANDPHLYGAGGKPPGEPSAPPLEGRELGTLSQERVDDAVDRARLRRMVEQPEGHFPNEDAARKLIYLAVTNAVPAWTRTRNWTIALLAFKIHFGDRVPDTEPDTHT